MKSPRLLGGGVGEGAHVGSPSPCQNCSLERDGGTAAFPTSLQTPVGFVPASRICGGELILDDGNDK